MLCLCRSGNRKLRAIVVIEGLDASLIKSELLSCCSTIQPRVFRLKAEKGLDYGCPSISAQHMSGSPNFTRVVVVCSSMAPKAKSNTPLHPKREAPSSRTGSTATSLLSRSRWIENLTRVVHLSYMTTCLTGFTAAAAAAAHAGRPRC